MIEITYRRWEVKSRIIDLKTFEISSTWQKRDRADVSRKIHRVTLYIYEMKKNSGEERKGGNGGGRRTKLAVGFSRVPNFNLKPLLSSGWENGAGREDWKRARRDRLEERAEKVEAEDEQGSFARLHTCTYMVIPFGRGGVSRIWRRGYAIKVRRPQKSVYRGTCAAWGNGRSYLFLSFLPSFSPRPSWLTPTRTIFPVWRVYIFRFFTPHM